MKVFDRIDNANFIHEDDTITNVTVTVKDIQNPSELLLLSSDAVFLNDYEGPIIEKYKSEDPYFIILKIFRPENIKKIVFMNGASVIYYVEFKDLKLRQKSLMRLIDTDSSSPENLEEYLHKLSKNSHKDAIQEYIFKATNKNFIKKKTLDLIYYKDKISNKNNSNLVTENFQLFYLGNLERDSQEMLPPLKHKSFRVDTADSNVDLNLNFYNEIVKKEFYLGD